MAEPYVSHSGVEYSGGFPITPGAGFGDVQPEQLGITPGVMDDLIAYNDKLWRLSTTDPLKGKRGEYQVSTGGWPQAIFEGADLPQTGAAYPLGYEPETRVGLIPSQRGYDLGVTPIGVGQSAVDLGPKDQYLTLGGKLVEEFSPLSRPLLSLGALGYQFPEVAPGGYRNIRGIWSDEPATDIINEAIRENILRIPGGYGSPAITEDLIDTEIRGLDDLSGVQRGGYKSLFRRWADLAKRFSPISTAEAKNTSIFRSPRVAVEPTPEEEIVISEALMDLREPRPIPFSDPVMLRGTRDPADTRKYLLDRQFGTGRDDRTPMVDTFAPPEPPYMVPVTNTEAMASDVQRALAAAADISKPRPRGMPTTSSVEPQLRALTELAQTDPTIAERYTTPGSQDLIDIATQVESFSALQEADQQRMERENRAAEAQVRADNQRRAEEAKQEQGRARENRQAQERQAAKARDIAEKSKAADDRKAAARAQARADAAAQRERQATIQRQEDERRKQATEKKKVDALLAKQMADMMRSMEETRRRRYTGGTGGALMWT